MHFEIRIELCDSLASKVSQWHRSGRTLANIMADSGPRFVHPLYARLARACGRVGEARPLRNVAALTFILTLKYDSERP
jgi:hypothetical protein